MTEPYWVTAKNQFAEQDRGEQYAFNHHAIDDKIPLPVTRIGFEALVSEAAAVHNLPCDDDARLLVAGFIHHIPRDVCTTTVGSIAAAIRKQLSNHITTMIYDEISEKRKAVLKESQEQPQLAVVKSTDETSA